MVSLRVLSCRHFFFSSFLTSVNSPTPSFVTPRQDEKSFAYNEGGTEENSRSSCVSYWGIENIIVFKTQVLHPFSHHNLLVNYSVFENTIHNHLSLQIKVSLICLIFLERITFFLLFTLNQLLRSRWTWRRLPILFIPPQCLFFFKVCRLSIYGACTTHQRWFHSHSSF